MITLQIDNSSVTVPEGTTLLEAAQRIGIWIRTLCHHEALTPYGGCRLCIVEVQEGAATRIVSSCTYKAPEGVNVSTCSDTIVALRKAILALLLAEVPQSPALQELAELLGVEHSATFAPRNDLCIACGRCIRVCKEIVGVQAIDFAFRGYKRVAASPFFEQSEDCIGCGTCAAVCPTGAIRLHDIPAGARAELSDGRHVEGPVRVIENWKVSFPFKRCTKCGEPFAPQVQLEYFTMQAHLPADFFDVCRECRQ